jgi:hypothetical protein
MIDEGVFAGFRYVNEISKLVECSSPDELVGGIREKELVLTKTGYPYSVPDLHLLASTMCQLFW